MHLQIGSMAYCVDCSREVTGRHECSQPQTERLRMSELERVVFMRLREAAIRLRAKRGV